MNYFIHHFKNQTSGLLEIFFNGGDEIFNYMSSFTSAVNSLYISLSYR